MPPQGLDQVLTSKVLIGGLVTFSRPEVEVGPARLLVGAFVQ